MVSGSLAMLYFFIGFHGGKQGRGQSPVEWGNFPYVSLSIHPSLWAIQPGLKPSQPGLRPSQPCLKPEAWLTGWLGLRSSWLGLRSELAGPDKWTNRWTDHSKTLPKPHLSKYFHFLVNPKQNVCNRISFKSFQEAVDKPFQHITLF